MNFIITTGMYLPVRVCGSLEPVQYVDYLSDAARMMPSLTQCTAFQSACRCTESILRKKTFPFSCAEGGQGDSQVRFYRPGGRADCSACFSSYETNN